MKTVRLIFTLSMLTAFLSCGKALVPYGVPDCVKQEIKNIQAEKVRNPPGSIWQYEYNGNIVYFIPAYCCDIPSRLLDSNCKLICNPDGGFTGKGDGKCADFFSARKNEKLIWKDERIKD